MWQNAVNLRPVGGTMQKSFSVAFSLVLCVVPVLFPNGTATAQISGTEGNPAMCTQLQDQIDEIVSISRSDKLSDTEKIKKLVDSWVKSLSQIQDASQRDPEVGKIAKDYVDSITKLLLEAHIISITGDKNVTPDVKNELDLLRERIRPYISTLKLKCPDLQLPAIGTK
jgi:hypothetical protein